VIQSQTILKVSDNSGAKTVKCIKVLGGFKRKFAVIGDVVIVSVQKLRNRSKETSKVKRKEIYKALIIRTYVKSKKKSGFESKFNSNAVALINKFGNPIGTRVIGPVSKNLLKKQFQRFVSIASGIV
jgi:large subunit ribosomal protein L14